MCVPGPGMQSAQRTDIDDASVRGAQVGQGFARDEKRAAGIGLKGCIPLFERQAFQSRGSEDGGIIDEQIDTAELNADRGDGGADGGLGADLALDDECTAA